MLVWAAYGGRETDGKYLDDCKVAEYVNHISSCADLGPSAY